MLQNYDIYQVITAGAEHEAITGNCILRMGRGRPDGG